MNKQTKSPIVFPFSSSGIVLPMPLTRREQQVAELRCLPELGGADPITRVEAGDRMNVSPSRVRNLEGQVYRKLARAAAAAAVRSKGQATPSAASAIIDAEGFEVSAAE